MRIGAGLALFLIAGTCTAAHAQTASDVLPVSTTPPATSLIAVEQIPDRADTDERFAQGVLLRAQTAGPVARLTPQLESIAQSVDEKLHQFRPDELQALPVMRLESLDRHWKFDAQRFARWQQDMRLATTAYASDAAELSRRRAAWEATQAGAATTSMPAALASRVDILVGELKQAEASLSVPLSRQIALGQRANTVGARIEQGRAAVGQAISSIDSRLMQLDSPPLWSASRTGYDTEAARTNIMRGLEIESRFMKEYSVARGGSQLALHLLQLLLLPLLIWAWRHSRRAMADEEEHAVARSLKRPFSAWVLLSMMATLAFAADAPMLLLQFAMLWALIPVLRQLPPDSQRLLGHWPYVASGLFLVERLGFVFLGSNYLYRLWYLALAVLGLGTTLWLLWRARREGHAQASGRVGQGLRMAARGSAALFAISILANVIGNASLAEMLGSAVIDSAYLGLLLYAGINVVVALLQLLLARPGLSRLRFAREHATPLVQLLLRLMTACALVFWVAYTLDGFRVFRPTYAAVSAALSYPFSLGEISLSLGHILIFFISILIAFWAAKTVRLLLHDEVLARMPLPRGVGNSVASLTYYAVLLAGLLVALSAAGFKLSQLAFVVGALGVGIGFGLQNVVNNFVSGLILMFERPIQPGDVVDIAGASGRVREIGMRATTIKTFEGADVVVPNGTLLSSNLTNWTLLDRNRRMEISVGVAYGSDPAQVMALLDATARDTPGITSDPPPSVLFADFGASSLDFTIRAWTHDYDHWVTIRSDLMTRIHGALGKAGLEIPFPQQDLHLRTISSEAGAALRPSAPPQPAQTDDDVNDSPPSR